MPFFCLWGSVPSKIDIVIPSTPLYEGIVGFDPKIINTGGCHLSQIFWEHENLYGISVICLISIKIYIKIYKEKEKNDFGKKSRVSGNPA